MPADARFRIRSADPADARAIHAAFVEAIEGLTTEDYGPEQREAWRTARGPDSFRAAVAGGREDFLVAEADGEVVGFGSLRGDEVNLLYARPAWSGRGVAPALLAALEALAAARGLPRVWLRSSLNARAFYERRGYRAVREGVAEPRPGVSLRTVLMEKALDSER